MAKRPIGDILRALDIVDKLERMTTAHDDLLTAMLDRLDAIERRLDQAGLPKP